MITPDEAFRTLRMAFHYVGSDAGEEARARLVTYMIQCETRIRDLENELAVARAKERP